MNDIESNNNEQNSYYNLACCISVSCIIAGIIGLNAL